MLFNSLPFLYFFLPVTYFVFWRLRDPPATVLVAHCHRLCVLRILELPFLRGDGILHARQLSCWTRALAMARREKATRLLGRPHSDRFLSPRLLQIWKLCPDECLRVGRLAPSPDRAAGHGHRSSGRYFLLTRLIPLLTSSTRTRASSS